MKREIFCAFLLGCSVLSAAEPQYIWDFEKKDSKYTWSQGAAKKVRLNMLPTAGKGFNNTAGGVFSGKFNYVAGTVLDYDNYTIEFKFKLDQPFVRGKSRGLFNYEFWSWSRRTFRIRIDKNGRIECLVQKTADTDAPFKFLLTGEVLKWETGKWYTLRLAARKGGIMNIYLDGKLIAAKDGAPGLKDINDGKKREYPGIIRPGWDTATPQVGHGSLEGVMDDIKIWNTFETPSAADQADADENSGKYILFAGSDKENLSGKFEVPDKAGYAYGSYTKADNKFIKAAAQASITSGKDALTVRFYCPVPEGMKVKKDGRSVWHSDYIELFLRPDPAKPEYFQYCAGTNGKTAAYRYPRSLQNDPDFVSKAKFDINTADPGKFIITITIPKAELGMQNIQDGMIFTGNFCRGGATAGGLTSWSPARGNFHALDNFGTIITGSAQAYFAREAAMLQSDADKISGRADIRAEFDKAMDSFVTANKTRGNDPAYFNSMNFALGNLKQLLVSVRLSGKPYFVWENDVWENRMEPTILSKPVEKISLRAAQNSKVLYGMTFSNLSDKPFLGLLKCLDKWPLQSGAKIFGNEPWNDFLRNITFYEGAMLENSGGQPFYDPMLPLPGKCVLRVPPHTSIPLWMTISTKGLKPGKYEGTIVFKSSYKSMPVETVKLELEVLPIDLGTVKLDSFHYAFFTERAVDTPHFTNIGNVYKYLADQEANVMFAGHFTDVYPEQNPDGTLHPIDFSRLDKKVATYIQSGIPADRLKLMFNLHTFIFIRNVVENGRSRNILPTLKFGTPEFEKGFTEFIRQVYAHLGKKFGLTPDRIIIYTGDEPEGDINDPKSRLYRVNYLGKLVKKAVPDAATVTNPFPRHGVDDKYKEALKVLAETHTHVIMVTKGKTPEVTELLKKHNFVLWTYAVLSNGVSPEKYRQLFYDSFRAGYGSANAYWAIDSYSGEGFDANDFAGNYNGGYTSGRTDYGSAYVDCNLGTVITGRRAEAHYQGLLDYKAMTMCRELIKKSPDPAAYNKKLDAIVERGSKGSIADQDACRQEIYDLIMELQKNTPARR
ncbi:MAG: LamG domain-containing protein [Lentisphaerae bacterium]|nr:LamG domain-containing protein [Lentisphaerota bacterium]